MRRAENEAETDEVHDQSDSSEHENPSVPVPVDTSTPVEHRVEDSLQDVANLRLSPSPADDATEHVSEIVNNVLCSASHELEESISLSDRTEQYEPIAALTDQTNTESDKLAVSNDSDLIGGNQPDNHSTDNRDSEADNKPSNTLHSKPETDADDFSCTSASIVVDGTNSDDLMDKACSLPSTDVTTHYEPVTVSVKEKIEPANVVQNSTLQSMAFLLLCKLN